MGQNIYIAHIVSILIDIGIGYTGLGCTADFVHIGCYTHANGRNTCATNGASHCDIINFVLAISNNNKTLGLCGGRRNSTIVGHSIIVNVNAIISTFAALRSQIAIIHLDRSIATNGVDYYSCAHAHACSASCAHAHGTTIILEMLIAICQNTQILGSSNASTLNLDGGIIANIIHSHIAFHGDTCGSASTHSKTHGQIENVIIGNTIYNSILYIPGTIVFSICSFNPCICSTIKHTYSSTAGYACRTTIGHLHGVRTGHNIPIALGQELYIIIATAHINIIHARQAIAVNIHHRNATFGRNTHNTSAYGHATAQGKVSNIGSIQCLNAQISASHHGNIRIIQGSLHSLLIIRAADLSISHNTAHSGSSRAGGHSYI